MPELSEVQDCIVSRFLAQTLEESEDLKASRFQIAEPKPEALQPHDLGQYCECSLHLSEKILDRPVFIGYSVLPHSPAGVCR
ncbi:MAG TPA: hypothetical protein VGC39_08645 [Candidatus Methylacidiphilales bacterium]